MRLLRMGSLVGRAEALSTYNGGGPSEVTSVTETEPPAHLRGPLNRLSQGAIGGGFNQAVIEGRRRGARGLDALFSRGTQGSPLIDQASGLTSQTIAGDFLSPDTNPFLEGTFNRAADLTRGRLDTEFAGAGRNLGASQPARSEELQTLASNIFGGNFQQERDRQLQAVNQATPLANVDFQNIQAMIDAGSFPLDQAINRIAGVIPGAGGVTTSTQPVFRTGLF